MTLLITLLMTLLSACSPQSKSQDAAQAGILTEVKEFEYVGENTRDGSIRYSEQPPVGGPHNPLWQTCGVYSKPIYNEYAVSSLSKGAIWVTYQPLLEQAKVLQLQTLISEYPKTLLSPYSQQDSLIVLTAWNVQLHLNTADADKIKEFLKQYQNNPLAPEQGGTCEKGYTGMKE